MTRFFTTTLVLSFFALTSFAQQRVILQSNGNASVFGGASAFTDAYDAASNGDTLYLAGQSYSVPNPFNKSITIFGIGYHPEHTGEIGTTRLSGDININEWAIGSHFEGIYFNNNISFAAAKIDDVTFKRCYISGNITLNGLDEDPSDNIGIIECTITGRINGQRTINILLENNIIIFNSNDVLHSINHSWIRNNIIVGRGSQQYNVQPYNRYVIVNTTECLFENNIIYNTERTSHTFSGVTNNTFNHNVFNYNPTGDANNSWNNNYTDVTIPDIFVDYTENSFSFYADYHLVDPASYQGNTGNQVSIYGGLNPFKENTRPSNPQILSKDIQNNTDVDGNLGVEIEVEAQDE